MRGLELIDMQHFWLEQAAFSLCITTLFIAAQEDSTRVRGMLGRLIHYILK